jgi:hypothetical protein
MKKRSCKLILDSVRYRREEKIRIIANISVQYSLATEELIREAKTDKVEKGGISST